MDEKMGARRGSYDDEGSEDGLGMFGDLGALEGGTPLEEFVDTDNYLKCPTCLETYKGPKLLSCLHVLCELCLNRLMKGASLSANVENGGAHEATDDDDEDPPAVTGILRCPLCQQETLLPDKTVASLCPDYARQSRLSEEGLDTSGILCTSCKAKEPAVAKCQDCDNYLGTNCHSAHQYMRCFENHKVVTFEEMIRNGQSPCVCRRPPTCAKHPGESLLYFCRPCQVPVCNQCLNSIHVLPDHLCKHLSEVELEQRTELAAASKETQAKLALCHATSFKFEKMLGELQKQRDAAHTAVLEAYETYKSALEKCKDKIVEELERLHSAQELKVMDTSNKVEKVMDRIDHASRFAESTAENADIVDMLLMKPVILSQLQALATDLPRPDELSAGLRFESNAHRFEEALNATFGHFVTPMPPPSAPNSHSSHSHSKTASTSLGLTTPSSTPIPPSPAHSSPLEENGGYALPSGVLSPVENLVLSMPPPAATAALPLDLSAMLTALPSDADLLTAGRSSSSELPSLSPLPTLNSLALGGGQAPVGALPSLEPLNYASATTAAPPRQGRPLDSRLSSMHHSMTSIQEYNLQQLANLAETDRGLGRAPPTPNTLNLNVNPASTFTLADLLVGDMNMGSMNNINALNNLQALAKLGSQGESEVDGSGRIPSVSPPTAPSPLVGSVCSGSLSPNVVSYNGGGSRLGLHHQFFSSRNGLNPVPSVSLLANKPNSLPCSMQIRIKFGQLGQAQGQFNSPHGFCLGMDEEILVADTNNHRIQAFDKNGTFLFEFGVAGKDEGQLWYPRKIAVMRNTSKIVVCDRGNERSRMQVFTKTGHFVKRIPIRYIDIVAGLCITHNDHIVVVDSVTPAVYRLSESGELLHWFDCSEYMREPSDIAVRDNEYYVCDFKGHCVVVFNEAGRFVRRIGCETITNYPNGIDISDAGDVVVGDSHGNKFHVTVFTKDGTLVSEFECPYVKVSRCCGLKITSEGYIVTLAKNNHHVLLLNTLYIS